MENTYEESVIINSMEKLVPVKLNDDNQAVISARQLHEFLGVKSDFRVWILRIIEYGFIENIDYTRALQKCNTPGGVQSMADYMLHIDMAKEICMLQKNEMGKIARKYFIKVEKKYNSPQALLSIIMELLKKNSNEEDTNVESANSKGVNIDDKNNNPMNFRQTAKEFGVMESFLINWLLLNDYCYRDDKKSLRPYPDKKQFFYERPFTTEHGHSDVQTMINSTGRDVFRGLLMNEVTREEEKLKECKTVKLLY